MRYIDADALIEDIQETICAKCGDISDGIKCKSCGMDDTLDFLEKAPTADVVPKSEVDGFPCVAYNKKHERYQVIHKGKDGRIFSSKLYYTRKDAEKALAELKKKYTEEKE